MAAVANGERTYKRLDARDEASCVADYALLIYPAWLVDKEGVQVKKFPPEVIEAMGKAAAEVIDELRQDEDELVKRITESFLAYRDSIGRYMTFADNGQMNARAAVMGY